MEELHSKSTRISWPVTERHEITGARAWGIGGLKPAKPDSMSIKLSCQPELPSSSALSLPAYNHPRQTFYGAVMVVTPLPLRYEVEESL